jgi:hypothetical protein
LINNYLNYNENFCPCRWRGTQFRRLYSYSSCTLAVKKLLITDQSSNDCIIEDKNYPHPFKITYVDLNAGVSYFSTSKRIFLYVHMYSTVGWITGTSVQVFLQLYSFHMHHMLPINISSSHKNNVAFCFQNSLFCDNQC